jgi:hypothetical protein
VFTVHKKKKKTERIKKRNQTGWVFENEALQTEIK